MLPTRRYNGTVFQDGFGWRSADVAQDSGEAIEVLTLAPRLASVPGFCERVAERVARLARVRHAMYARVRGLETAPDGAVRLISDRAEGWRLAHVLAVVEQHRLTLDAGAVLGLLRQMISAVALFSRHQRDAAIGTIGPERLVVTPQGRLVIAEYVLAPGIEQLQYSRERFWRELRVALPPGASPARIPPTADVVGVGVTALSLALGRLLREDEYLVSLGDLVEVMSAERGPHVGWSPEFSSWLRRVLQFDPRSAFVTPHEAQAAFEEVLSHEREYSGQATGLQALLAEHRALFETAITPPPLPDDAHTSVAPVTVTAGSSEHKGPADIPRTASTAAAPAGPDVPSKGSRDEARLQEARPQAVVVQSLGAVSDDPSRETLSVAAPEHQVAAGATFTRWRVIAAAAILVACAEAAALAWLVRRERPALLDRGELVVQSRPAAARVTIDGEERGITPYTTQLSAGTHILEVRVGRSEPRVIPLLIRPGVQSGLYVELQSVATVGALEVRSAPASARVSVAGQHRGSTPLLVKDLPPGEVDVVVETATRRVRQTVRIEPGITSQLVVPLDH